MNKYKKQFLEDMKKIGDINVLFGYINALKKEIENPYYKKLIDTLYDWTIDNLCDDDKQFLEENIKEEIEKYE